MQSIQGHLENMQNPCGSYVYNIQGHIADLNRGIEMAEKEVDLCPTSHPDHAVALGNLALYLTTRYQKQDSMMDLNRAIDLRELALKLCPPNHWDYPNRLHRLALLLHECYQKTKNQSELNRAINLLKEALGIYSPHHPRFAFTVQSLAAAILLLSKSASHPSNQLQDEAFKTYRMLKKCAPAVSLHLLEAVQDWVQNAEKYSHSSVLEAYQTSLDTLDHFTSLNSSLDSRHETMQARVTDLANNAFSCGIRHGDFQMAVELLEQGRGILWN